MNNFRKSYISEFIFALYLFLITSGLIFPVLFSYNSVDIDNSFFVKLTKYIPLFYFFIILSKHISSKFSYIDLGIFIISFYYFLSIYWSSSKIDSLFNSIQFFIFIYILILIKKSKIFSLFRSFIIFLILTLFFSFLFLIFEYKNSFMDGFHEGRFRGIFLHKNNLGSILASLLPFILFSTTLKYKVLILIFSIFFIVLSGSTTSILTVFIVFLIYYIVGKRFNKSIYILIGSLFVIIPYVYSNYWSSILNFFNKSEQLTGRTVLWNNLIEAISLKPIFGYGYFGFWNSEEKDMAFQLMEWDTGKAHNAFLEVLLNGGFVLLFIFILWLISSFVISMKTSTNLVKGYRTTSLIVVFILSLSEITLLSHNNFYFIILFCTTLNSNFNLK